MFVFNCDDEDTNDNQEKSSVVRPRLETYIDLNILQLIAPIQQTVKQFDISTQNYEIHGAQDWSNSYWASYDKALPYTLQHRKDK